MWLLAVVLALLVIIFTSVIIYARWNYGTLEKLGIPVVTPSFILGSTSDLHKKVAHYEDIERFKKYGPIYGVYEGRSPQVHICDPELIRLIYIKDFDHFHDRRAADLGDPILNEILDFVPGEKWKEIRTALTPTLSTTRIKAMVATTREVIQEYSKRLSGDLDKNAGRLKIDVREQVAGIVIDFLAQCSFGIRIGDAYDPNNYFVKTFKTISGNDKDFDLMYNLALTFPILTRFAPTLDNTGSSKLADTFRNVMKERASDPNYAKRNDLADKLIEMLELASTPKYKRLGITENTILAQAVGGFFLAAYDSIITGITMAIYYLAQNPQAQARAQGEVDKYFAKRADTASQVTLDSMTELPFLGACIKEALRLVPPFIRPERICTKDWAHEKLTLKAGTIVMLPAWAYHRNPELFPNPYQFLPERYISEKTDSYSFATYGFGPRNCPGTRFANESMKMCMAYLVKQFQFKPRPDTKVVYKPGVLFLVMYESIFLDVLPR